MKNNVSARNPAMDIIRCFALLSVISVHFFLNTGYYYAFMTGSRLYVMTLIRCASMICVPLFIMLSGALLNKKRPDRSYFSKLGKTISLYFLSCACCYLYTQFLTPDAPGTGSVKELILKAFSYTAAPYAWYMEMYFGLFLLMPYLNLCYHGLQTKKDRQVLLLVMTILTALPGVANMFTFAEGISFTAPDFQVDMLLPNYWLLCYPITYYFLGAYLREHPLKVRRSVNLLLILGIMFINGSLNYLICQDDYYVQGSWQTWGALPNMIQSALVFNYLAQGDYSRLGSRTCRMLGRMSDWCFGGFLVSWIFDDYFYGILKQIQPELVLQLPYYPVIVPVVFICSLCLSALLNTVHNLLAGLLTALLPKKSAAK